MTEFALHLLWSTDCGGPGKAAIVIAGGTPSPHGPSILSLLKQSTSLPAQGAGVACASIRSTVGTGVAVLSSGRGAGRAVGKAATTW
jgi:hypothetical protein